MAMEENYALLSSDDRRAIYGIPIFLPSERDRHFTLNSQETKFVRSLNETTDAVYFIISLAYFRRKKTLVDFSYQDATYDRRYVMQRYFSNKLAPRTLPDQKTRIKLDNKVLKYEGYQRINTAHTKIIAKQLKKVARHHPKQNKLFQTLLDLMITNKIAIPGYRTMIALISNAWDKEIKRLIGIYYRNTNKQQREFL